MEKPTTTEQGVGAKVKSVVNCYVEQKKVSVVMTTAPVAEADGYDTVH